MEHISRWVAKDWFWLCVGIILTIIATRAEYGLRGGLEIGAEWLIIPVSVAVGRVLRAIKRAESRRR